MPVIQLQDQKVSLKGSVQCSDEYGTAKRDLQVLASTDEGGQFAQAGNRKHGQVLLKDGSGSAKAIAVFSKEQARQLAKALNAAADAAKDAAGADIKADC